MKKPEDFSIALQALTSAAVAILKTPGVTECTMDNDHRSAEIIFIANGTDYVLKLAELEEENERS